MVGKGKKTERWRERGRESWKPEESAGDNERKREKTSEL